MFKSKMLIVKPICLNQNQLLILPEQEVFWESPVVWSYDGVVKSESDKPNFQAFMNELSIAFKPGGLNFNKNNINVMKL